MAIKRIVESPKTIFLSLMVTIAVSCFNAFTSSHFMTREDHNKDISIIMQNFSNIKSDINNKVNHNEFDQTMKWEFENNAKRDALLDKMLIKIESNQESINELKISLTPRRNSNNNQ